MNIYIHMDDDMKKLASIILPILVKLMNENSFYKKNSLSIISEMIIYDHDLQAQISDSNLLSKVQSLITPFLDDDTHFVCLKFLNSISTLSEQGRNSIATNANLLSFLFSSISHSSEEIREKSSECFKGLSRSSLSVRNILMENRAYIPLFQLFHETNEKILINIVICLGNLLLDFSSLKSEILETDAILSLFKFVHSNNYLLKIKSISAIKNMAFQADSNIKKFILKELIQIDVKSLLIDKDDTIQKITLNLMRNLLDSDYDDISNFFDSLGEEIILYMIQNTNVSNPKIVYEVLYIINNVSASLLYHKKLIMNEKILNFVLENLKNGDDINKEASMSVLLNLTWNEFEVEKRKVVLLEMDFLNELEKISSKNTFHDLKTKAIHIIKQLK